MPYAERADFLAYQAKYDKQRLRDRKEYWKKRNKEVYKKLCEDGGRVRNFIACDGEGFTLPDSRISMDLFGFAGMAAYNTRQEYGLLRIGETLLMTGKNLSTDECLEFIVSRNPRAGIYVGYYFDYDATMILRDLPEHIARRINLGLYTSYKKYVIRYIPRQHLSVGLLDKQGKTIKESSVTINDVGSFFQCKFTQALRQWNAAPDDVIERIQKGKDKRGTETCVDDEMIEYNALECDYLSELMDNFADVVQSIGITPVKWRGPGWIAAKALAQNHVIKRVAVENILSDEIRAWAPDAFYGGRFETPMIGDIGRAYAYDLNSAYPAAMQYLPCLECCRIRKFSENERLMPHSLALIEFEHPRDTQRLCGIPIRSEKGILYWPRKGKGWYWGVEILAAQNAGMTIKVLAGWHIYKNCEHKPFAFVRDLYDERKRVGKDAKGIALKLAYNSIYGKLVQHVGTRPFYNPIWAGLITAYVRSWLIKGYAQNQDDIAMIATDALYSRKALQNLIVGDDLGQWSREETENLFIVQPGIYEAKGRAMKTRGVDKGILSEVMNEFREAWRKYMQVKGGPLPSNQVMVHAFTGLKLALAQNKYWIAGSWNDNPRVIHFDWTGKRRSDVQFKDNYVATWPRVGDAQVSSKTFDPNALDVRAQLDILTYAQPDHINIL